VHSADSARISGVRALAEAELGLGSGRVGGGADVVGEADVIWVPFFDFRILDRSVRPDNRHFV
jgi:hypothetical protein